MPSFFQDALRTFGEQEKIELAKEKDDALKKYNELNDQVFSFPVLPYYYLLLPLSTKACCKFV
jgi:hypothetical protein